MQFKQHTLEKCAMPGPCFPLLPGDLYFHICPLDLYTDMDKMRPHNYTDDDHDDNYDS